MAEIFRWRSLPVAVSGPALGFFDVIGTGVVGAGNKIDVHRFSIFTDTVFPVTYFVRIAANRWDIVTQAARTRKEFGGDIRLNPGDNLGINIVTWAGAPIQILNMRAEFTHRINEP